MSHPHQIIDNGTERFTLYFDPAEGPQTVRSDHPAFTDVLAALERGDPRAATEAVDASAAVARRFDRVTERVSVAHGRVYFDGDPVDDSVTRLILRYLEGGARHDVLPLARFMENVAANPMEHSRAQLFDWLRALDFTIDRGGNVVGYKGVGPAPDYLSGWSGGAIVNGTRVDGHVPNVPASVVELPRGDVAHDPAASCSRGLHVGTYGYAQSYANPTLLEVRVNPRDVVSVPTDAGGNKIRVCRYYVVSVTTLERPGPYADDPADDFDPCEW